MRQGFDDWPGRCAGGLASRKSILLRQIWWKNGRLYKGWLAHIELPFSSSPTWTLVETLYLIPDN